MTPAARLQAAIEILDQVLAGEPAEKALTSWGRRSRFAGSKDRAAVRDHVFDAVRCLRSHTALGGSRSGRGLILGALREAGQNPDEVFTGQGHAPAPLTDGERELPSAPAGAEALDIPDWLWPDFAASLGDQAEAAALAMRSRAPVHLRVNSARGTVEQAVQALAAEGIIAEPHPAAATALEVTEGARKLRNAKPYQDGLVELQDAASQAVTDRLPLTDGMKVLDYCAGGGGKTLAMAARASLQSFAHDAEPRRMKDLPARAARAGAKVSLLSTADLASSGPFDLVLCDVPCSGSGSWRRAPEGKWRLTAEGLADLQRIQGEILRKAAGLVSQDGVLAYATCSMLDGENIAQVQRFMDDNPGWDLADQNGWQVQDGTDGFYVAVLTRAKRG
ncbi:MULTISPECIES: RsmB/NOP family class I SAM-dependent RNA methyltransferase [unclassified Leisingera]|uniref:RsmB/NOP family class I SAM-dependent RNA methyltransferase n=1 Tax=unclassified Leisingera TaxID=2614906 RepID=UPI0002E1FF37|nr:MULTISPECIES: RsmB/NOP family class I SAM-dependent RNA methyltransferase [unclassified Leisingera]KIC25148.1 SAM-dependent methlyltransferase [Leisingera sp. ANG-S3]KIC54799.1 SAM-dependent methlyltransferase [Leisingera sp. ANG-S]KID10434.1 SAM-dependent methlyltransferase [Leisingera sp. ANG1]